MFVRKSRQILVCSVIMVKETKGGIGSTVGKAVSGSGHCRLLFQVDRSIPKTWRIVISHIVRGSSIRVAPETVTRHHTATHAGTNARAGPSCDGVVRAKHSHAGAEL